MAKDSFVYNLFGRSRRQVPKTARDLGKLNESGLAGRGGQRVDLFRPHSHGIDTAQTAAWVLERFEGFTQIGEGTYGVVYKAFRIGDGVPVALKKIRLTTEGTDTLAATGVSTTAIREMLLLRGLVHQNIVELADVHFTTYPTVQLWLVFEYCLMDLRQYIKFVSNARRKCDKCTDRSLPMNQVKLFMKQILRGLHFCHAMNVLHRDMKPQNILLTLPKEALCQVSKPALKACEEGPTSSRATTASDTDNRFTSALADVHPVAYHIYHHWTEATAKIADLGLARSSKQTNQPLTAEVITLWYRPPELLLGTARYGRGVDIWSMGCILAEMITGKALFPGDCEIGTLFKIFKLLGTPQRDAWAAGTDLPHFQEVFPKWEVADRSAALQTSLGVDDKDAIDLIERCLRWRSEERITAGEALDHVWFREQ